LLALPHGSDEAIGLTASLFQFLAPQRRTRCDGVPPFQEQIHQADHVERDHLVAVAASIAVAALVIEQSTPH